MRYFKLEALGDYRDKKLAIISKPPADLGVYAYCPVHGESMAAHYPADARTYLQPKDPGIKLCSLVGNTINWLIVDAAFKDSVLEHGGPGVEILPLAIYNHKKRLHSADYWVINPLGSFDCVDRDQSQIEYLDDTKAQVVGVDSFVLTKDKMDKAPGIFRVPEELSVYFVNQTLAKSLKDKGCTNVFLEEVEAR